MAPAAAGGLPPSTHTDCRTGAIGAMRTGSKERIGGDEVTFVPFAQFKYGNTIFSRSVGYHSDGDLVVLREDSTSDSDAARGQDRRFRSTSTQSRLHAVHKMDQPLNMKKVEEHPRGLRAFPGVAGPRGKAKHRRFRNQFFVGDHPAKAVPAAEEDVTLGRPPPMTKDQYQELFTPHQHTDFQFHDGDGEIHAKWRAFIEITEAQQARYLGARARPKPAPSAHTIGGTPAQRWSRLGRSIRAELGSVASQRETFVQPVEERLLHFLDTVDASHKECTEPPVVALKFDDGYHRLLCHGIVAYYCLVSVSETGDDGERYTIISAPKSPPFPFPRPDVSLLDHVAGASARKETDGSAARPKKRRGRGRKP
eukprot:TRINITY_DN15397_c0_g1_i1.p1 TRINITY_DN15397_c0_g1~~TRINITY_DN15397_c0_g1_i1.p1  ORF type:complete len:420 (+),score=135.32 TRINITY_DN15397_c0_g1_i1:160-1260(+)